MVEIATLLLTTAITGVVASSMTGSKSLKGSYGTFAKSCGLVACVAVEQKSSV